MCIYNAVKVKEKDIPLYAYKLIRLNSNGEPHGMEEIIDNIFELWKFSASHIYDKSGWNSARSEKKKFKLLTDNDKHYGRLQVLSAPLEDIIKYNTFECDEIWKVEISSHSGGYVGSQSINVSGPAKCVTSYLVDSFKFVECVHKYKKRNRGSEDMRYKSNDNVFISVDNPSSTSLKKGDIVKIKGIYSTQNKQYSTTVIQSANKTYIGHNYSFYEWELEPMSKDKRIEYIKREIRESEMELESMKQELEFLEKYEDKDDYVAHKIIEDLGNKKMEPSKLRKLLQKYKNVDKF